MDGNGDALDKDYLFFDDQDPCDRRLDLESVDGFSGRNQSALVISVIQQCTSGKGVTSLSFRFKDSPSTRWITKLLPQISPFEVARWQDWG